MSHDNDFRAQPPKIANYRGQGVAIRFLCPRCGKPSSQTGSKLRRFGGLRQRVCGGCYEVMTR